jgi:hypothetical protein
LPVDLRASTFVGLFLALVAGCGKEAAWSSSVVGDASTAPDGATSIANWPIDAGTKNGPFDWVGIIGTGQSLSIGCASTAISTQQPFKNFTLIDTGPDPKYPIDGSTAAKWSFTPLVEPTRRNVPGYPGDGQYPNNVCSGVCNCGETPHSGFANTMSTIWAARGNGDYVTAHSVVGEGGACLSQIDKAGGAGGDRTYPAGLSETRVFKRLADAAGKKYGVAAILLTHGECDAMNRNTGYEAGVYQLWQDYNADLKAITGQTRDVVLFASQESSIPDGLDSPAVEIWRAGKDHPGKIVCVGPKYAYGNYGLHLPAAGYERLGEKYAEVFDYVVNRGAPWKPVGPSQVTRSGAVINVTFDVPIPPLVWDTHLSPPHQSMHTAWANGRGFEVTDASGNEIAIASTEIQGNNVLVTLASPPAAGTALTLAYALTADGGAGTGGKPDGMHGLLRDSDGFVGWSNETLDLQVKQGSTTLFTTDVNQFYRRGALDIVTAGPGLPDDTVVTDVEGPLLTLSNPWTGPTGIAHFSFHHNHYNYAVHFSLPVP